MTRTDGCPTYLDVSRLGGLQPPVSDNGRYAPLTQPIPGFSQL